MTKFQKIITTLFVIITLSILYFFVIRPNIQTKEPEYVNPALIINSISDQKQGKYTVGDGIVRYYDDINKLISTKESYSSELKIYTESFRAPISYDELLILPEFKTTISFIKKYLEKNGFTRNIKNSFDGYFINNYDVDSRGEYFEGYENGDTKCIISNYIGVQEKYLGKIYTPLKITCSNGFEKQKELQIKLIDIMGDNKSGIYIDNEGGGFFHAGSMGHGGGGVEMIFREKGITYELIYEGNSGIPCSVVQQYNIPFYISGECY